MDARSGDSYRYTHSNEDGSFVFFGEFREVEPPRLLVRPFDFESNEHGQSVGRAEFEEVTPDRTRLVITGTFPSLEARDAMLQAGMEKGVSEGYEELDELLVRLVQDQKN